MSQVNFTGFESDETGDFIESKEFDPGSVGSLTVTTSDSHSGDRCLEVDHPGDGTNEAYLELRGQSDATGDPANFSAEDAYFTCYLKILEAPSAEGDVVWFHMFRFAGSPFIKGGLGYNYQRKIVLEGAYGYTLATGTTVLNTGQWYRIQARFGTNSAEGEGDAPYEVHIDGVTEFSGTGDLDHRPTVTCWIIAPTAMESSFHFRLDDASISDSGFIDASASALMQADSAGTHTGWTGTYQDADENPHDGDTTYLGSSANAKETVNLESASSAGIPTGSTILAIRCLNVVRHVSGVGTNMRYIARSNSVEDTTSTDEDPEDYYVARGKVLETDFGNNNDPWSISSLNGLEAGVHFNAMFGAGIRCTQIAVSVLYEPPAVQSSVSGTSAGEATVTGGIVGRSNLAGTATAVAACLAAILGVGILNGASDGLATAAADTVGLGSIQAQSAGSAQGLGSLGGMGHLGGLIEGQAGAQANVLGIGRLTASSAGAATGEATIEATGHLVGTADALAETSGILFAFGPLMGSGEGAAEAIGELAGLASLSGATNGVADALGDLLGLGPVSGMADGASGVTGELAGLGSISALAAGIAVVTGEISSGGSIEGQAAGVATVVGVLTGIGDLLGSSAGIATTEGTLIPPGLLQGESQGTATAMGILGARAYISGLSVGRATVIGALNVGEYHSYLDIEVLELEPNRLVPYDDEYQRKFTLLDTQTGKRWADEDSPAPANVRPYLWTAYGRREIAAMFAFLDRRKGAAVPFWLPSWEQDLRLASDAMEEQTILELIWVRYAQQMFPDTNARRHLAVYSVDQPATYHTIQDADDPGDQATESVTIAPETPRAWPAMSTTISFLRLSRLDQDETEITWHGLECAEAKLTIRELPNEAPA